MGLKVGRILLISILITFNKCFLGKEEVLEKIDSIFLNGNIDIGSIWLINYKLRYHRKKIGRRSRVSDLIKGKRRQ